MSKPSWYHLCISRQPEEDDEAHAQNLQREATTSRRFPAASRWPPLVIFTTLNLMKNIDKNMLNVITLDLNDQFYANCMKTTDKYAYHTYWKKDNHI